MDMNRRGFIGGILAAGSAPMLFNGCATGFLANRRINIGVVGFGRIAHSMDVPLTIKFYMGANTPERKDYIMDSLVCDSSEF